ncbi:ArsC family reductase [Vibrio sp. Of7-15]|uniref:ArsC family reductase n=1 Tax=Vibrio sp. Of7-15 TaxID=2724879 RepID=UPI001EF2BEA6|nr:ArsC family reductase [Vibrio sp. Of7-15]MCG7498439.1 ArsC family reductase [Vibrio sp. Of7-15]
MTTQVFGIKNCDTIKKARKWLTAEEIDYTFHDYRVDGINEEMIQNFVAQLGWEAMVNKRGTTYRQLSDEQKETLNQDTAIALMIEFPAMIKRPLLVHNDEYHLGFKADQYSAIFNK